MSLQLSKSSDLTRRKPFGSSHDWRTAYTRLLVATVETAVAALLAPDVRAVALTVEADYESSAIDGIGDEGLSTGMRDAAATEAKAPMDVTSPRAVRAVIGPPRGPLTVASVPSLFIVFSASSFYSYDNRPFPVSASSLPFFLFLSFSPPSLCRLSCSCFCSLPLLPHLSLSCFILLPLYHTSPLVLPASLPSSLLRPLSSLSSPDHRLASASHFRSSPLPAPFTFSSLPLPSPLFPPGAAPVLPPSARHALLDPLFLSTPLPSLDAALPLLSPSPLHFRLHSAAPHRHLLACLTRRLPKKPTGREVGGLSQILGPSATSATSAAGWRGEYSVERVVFQLASVTDRASSHAPSALLAPTPPHGPQGISRQSTQRISRSDSALPSSSQSFSHRPRPLSPYLRMRLSSHRRSFSCRRGCAASPLAVEIRGSKGGD
ncbi:unnamed protein product [Closterium sp. NIES-64]|nr:unnamed protein product [Closterium sp. NIES-64]